jgi:hypothetical protein
MQFHLNSSFLFFDWNITILVLLIKLHNNNFSVLIYFYIIGQEPKQGDFEIIIFTKILPFRLTL